MQCACVILPSVSYTTIQNLFHISSQTARFSFKKELLNTKLVLIFSTPFCLKYFPFYEEIIEIWSKMQIGLRVKHQLFSSDFNETWIFSTYFRKIFKYQFLNIFSKNIHISISQHIFEKYSNINFSTYFRKIFKYQFLNIFSKNIQISISQHIFEKYSNINSQHIFEKCSNMKFHKSPSSGSWVIPYGRTDADYTEMTSY